MNATSELKSIVELRETVRCTACCRPMCRFNDLRGDDYDGPPRSGTTVCQECGHIMRLDNGRLRNLNADEKKSLPSHEQAREIRALQDSIVERLIG